MRSSLRGRGQRIGYSNRRETARKGRTMLYPIILILTKLMVAATILSHERVPEWEVRCNPAFTQCWVQNVALEKQNIYDVRYVTDLKDVFYESCAAAEGAEACTRGAHVVEVR